MGCVEDHAMVLGEYTITVDALIKVDLGYKKFEIYASPRDLEYLVKGLGALEGKAVEVIEVKAREEVLVRGRIVGELEVKVTDGRVSWSEVVKAVRGLYSVAPKSVCPLAVHLGGVYVWENGYKLRRVFMDVSRHSLALKMAGYLTEVGGRVPLASLSARISGDAARALASGGYKILASFHHPLLSTMRAVGESGVTLVGKNSKNQLSVIANPQRIEGYEGPSIKVRRTKYKVMGDTC